ncbi:uncharacterized protein LOC142161262 [Mixophyes fleayi]|uniref:uncharacterized protein LOC142161262 n=1 Tax=Mixophyes fleayi TaxID=3061075 RepID=UPI003F4D89A7
MKMKSSIFDRITSLSHTHTLSPSSKLCILPREFDCEEDNLGLQHSLQEKSMIIQSLSSQAGSESNVQHQPCLLEMKKLIQKLQRNQNVLGLVSSFVQKNKDTMLPLKADGLSLRICDLNGTICMGQKYMLEAWQHLYLPKSTRMEVLGTLECSGSMAPTLQWIILVAENGKIYAYEHEELHLIAMSLRQFVEKGFQRRITSYFYPDVSDEKSFQEDADIQIIKQRTRHFVDKHSDEFDDFLDFFSS